MQVYCSGRFYDLVHSVPPRPEFHLNAGYFGKNGRCGVLLRVAFAGPSALDAFRLSGKLPRSYPLRAPGVCRAYDFCIMLPQQQRGSILLLTPLLATTRISHPHAPLRHSQSCPVRIVMG